MIETVRRSDWTGGNVRAYGSFLFPGSARHHHRIPGVWDDDNGAIGGKLCEPCWRDNRPVSIEAVRRAVVAAA